MLGFLPLWANAAIFAASGFVVWGASSRLAVHVDEIAERSGMGKAFSGMLLLGGITSLPEIATVVSASWTGNAALAVNNLMGSPSINILLLAIADLAVGRGTLTSAVIKPSTLFQSTLGMLLLAVVAIAVIAGDVAVIAGTGAWSSALFGLCILSLWLASRYEERHVWMIAHDQEREAQDSLEEEGSAGESPFWSLIAGTVTAAALILIAGFLLAQTGDAMAHQSGLSAGVIGLLLLGFATSLPELSSIIAAVRIRQYELAVGDILGTNLFNVALIFLADLTYQGGPVLAEAGTFEAIAALLGVLMTGVFLLGLLVRSQKTVLRLGYDSVATVILYALGVSLLLSIQP